MANYELNTGGRGRKSRATVVHVNNIKAWHQDAYTINRVVLAQDDDLEDSPPALKLVERELSEEQLFHIDNLKQKYHLSLTNTPGIADVPPHSINTGDHLPIARQPYRIPEKWKGQLIDHTQELLGLSVIRPSTSPWCSSSNSRENDGSLRLCQDYRPLNAITVPDPYSMKRVDDRYP